MDTLSNFLLHPNYFKDYIEILYRDFPEIKVTILKKNNIIKQLPKYMIYSY